MADHDSSERDKKKAQIQRCLIHLALNVTTLTFPIVAGPKFVGDAYNGDFPAAARFIGLCSAGTAALEFLVNPTLGCWSDDAGRRYTFLVGPIVSTLTSLAYASSPSLAMTAFVRVVGNGANAVSGSMSVFSALGDICKGDQALFISAVSSFGSYAGFGVIMGPGIGGFLLDRYDSTAAVYLGRAAFAACHSVWLYCTFEETLRPENRRPFAGGMVSPFSFVELFTKTSMLAQTTAYNALRILCEGKCLNDINQMWMKARLGFSVPETANWTMAWGFGGVLGGYTAGPMTKRFGRSFPSVSALIGTAAFVLYTVPRKWAFWAAMCINVLSAGGDSTVKSSAQAQAQAAGLGLGEYNGKFANLRALVYVVGPLLYSQLYAFAVARGYNQGTPYFACAVLSQILPEICFHMRWTDEQLNPPAKAAGAKAN